MLLEAIDHVQLAMPPGEEDRARAFYASVLALTEVPKPPDLAKRGGVWFEHGAVKVHLGVEAEFRPAKKAHPGFRVRGLDELLKRCKDAGYSVTPPEAREGAHHGYVDDPFGNRLEFLERT